MRIGHFQCECRAGEFEANLAKVLRGVERAEADGVEIVSFPECALTGYTDRAEQAKRIALAMDGPEVRHVLERTRAFDQTVIVGLSERDREDLYITSFVARRGELLGLYRKCSAYEPFNKQGREFPVFTRGDLCFGIVICSDGGYIEPTRILALKGARVIFAPHYNYITPGHLLTHFHTVRADHTARAVENGVYFLRGNSVTFGRDTGFDLDGVGYGDSYLVDPHGEILTRSRRHAEDFIQADIPPAGPEDARGRNRSAWSAGEFGEALAEAMNEHLFKGKTAS